MLIESGLLLTLVPKIDEMAENVFVINLEIADLIDF